MKLKRPNSTPFHEKVPSKEIQIHFSKRHRTSHFFCQHSQCRDIKMKHFMLTEHFPRHDFLLYHGKCFSVFISPRYEALLSRSHLSSRHCDGLFEINVHGLEYGKDNKYFSDKYSGGLLAMIYIAHLYTHLIYSLCKKKCISLVNLFGRVSETYCIHRLAFSNDLPFVISFPLGYR